MLDNSFQIRYQKLPIAIYGANEAAKSETTPFIHVHQHREFEVIGIINGACEIFVDNYRYVARPGDLLLFPPYSIHSGNILPGASFAHFCFCFDTSILGEKDIFNGFENGYLDVERRVDKTFSAQKDLYMLAKSIYEQCKTKQDSWDTIVQGLLLTLVGTLTQNNIISSLITNQAGYDFASQVLEKINENYDKDITSKDIAEEMSFNQSYFCRLFRNIFSSSFQKYLCSYRLYKAKLLLTQSDLSISEVAAKVGFNTTSYFCKKFKEMYGTSPKKFESLYMNLL